MEMNKKPTVFFLGKKKPNAPKESVLTKKQIEECRRDVDKFLAEFHNKRH